jgi:hypothetical protein
LPAPCITEIPTTTAKTSDTTTSKTVDTTKTTVASVTKTKVKPEEQDDSEDEFDDVEFVPPSKSTKRSASDAETSIDNEDKHNKTNRVISKKTKVHN